MSLFSIHSVLGSAAESFEYGGREWFRGFLHSISTECLNQTLANVFSLTLPEHLISPLCFIFLHGSSQIYSDTGLYHTVCGHQVQEGIQSTYSNTNYMLTHTISHSHTHIRSHMLSYIHTHTHTFAADKLPDYPTH